MARERRNDWLIAAALAALALALYAATLLPDVGVRDTAEFQRVAPQLGVAHPTGYPLYLLLGWLWSHLPLGGSAAWRMNLFSAVAAAGAIGLVYLVARALGQPRPFAALAALALAVSRVFWSQATIAEVYALAALLQALLLLALLRWRAGLWPLWAVGLALGLGLAHHRTIVLMLPGAAIFGLLALRRRPVSARAAGAALAVFAACCLLYAYLPLRAPAWIDSWEAFRQYVSGSAALSAQLDPARALASGPARLTELAARELWPQFLPLGALLALAGAARLLRRDIAAAALLLGGYATVLLFCAAFAVDDVDVFLIPAHLIAALLLGEGAAGLAALARRVAGERPRFARAGALAAGGLLLLVPALLLAANLGVIRAANSDREARLARAILAPSLPPAALLVTDWEQVEQLRYMQQIEGLRPDVEVHPLNRDQDHWYIEAALRRGRAAYLLRPWPDLGLAQWPEGRLWRVGDRPPQMPIATTADARWREGIRLAGFTLPPGPYRPGDVVPVTLAWQASATPTRRYTLFVHLIAADGTLAGQQDREPSTPTDGWRPGQRLTDLYGPTIGLDAPPGRYHVVIGWYAFPSLERLPRADAPGDAFTLGEIEVAAP